MWVDMSPADDGQPAHSITDWLSIGFGVMNLADKFGGSGFSDLAFEDMVTFLLERLSPLLLHGPGVAGMRFHLPTSPLRYLTFKLTNDLRRLPAVRELVRAFLRALFSGDTSQARRGGGKGC